MPDAKRRALGMRFPGQLHGILWLLAASFMLVVSAALIKSLSSSYSAGVQTFYRQLAGLLVLLPMIIKRRDQLISFNRLPLLILRSIVQCLGFILGFWSFALLPLAEANALSFTRAFWVVPLAAIFLKEDVSATRIVAMLVGAAGVLVMLRPAELSASLGAAVAIGGALMIAVANISVKSLSQDHDTGLLVIWSSGLGVVLTAPFLVQSPVVPGLVDLVWLALMGTTSILAQVCYIKGIRTCDVSVAAIVDYSRLLFAGAIGWILFDEGVTTRTLAGGAIIIAAGLILAVSERRKVPAEI